MALSAEERMSFLLYCPRCRQSTTRAVAWLASHERLPCITPDCGGAIDLQTGANRALVEKLSDYCTALDESLK